MVESEFWEDPKDRMRNPDKVEISFGVYEEDAATTRSAEVSIACGLDCAFDLAREKAKKIMLQRVPGGGRKSRKC
jgi:GH15 family glucan-1,4-alpha-glucosidase